MASAISKGPTSSQKKRRGKPRGSRQDSIIITDIDTCSCFLGTVESIATGRAVIVKDLHTDKLIHCTTRKINTKFFNKGTPVVFSYISDNNGEVIANYSVDNITELTCHFKINDTKAAKHVGQITNINNLSSLSCIDTEFDNIINNLKLQQNNIDNDIDSESINNSDSESDKELEKNLNKKNSNDTDLDTKSDDINNIAIDTTPTIKNKKLLFKSRNDNRKNKNNFFINI